MDGQLYPGVVIAVCGGGSYDVLFDDGAPSPAAAPLNLVNRCDVYDVRWGVGAGDKGLSIVGSEMVVGGPKVKGQPALCCPVCFQYTLMGDGTLIYCEDCEACGHAVRRRDSRALSSMMARACVCHPPRPAWA